MNPTPTRGPSTEAGKRLLNYLTYEVGTVLEKSWFEATMAEAEAEARAEARPTVERLEALEALFAAAQRLNAFATWSALGRPETEAFLAALYRAAAASAPKEAGE